ncbi:MAG: DUF2911 domain-containing protein [Acidobacteriota bacterium]
MTHRKTLKAVCALAVLLLLAVPALAERGDDTNRKSKNGAVSGTIDGVSVAVSYGRPQVKGREIFGALVPFGKLWRTGADEATTVTFGGDAKVEGQAIPAGTYSLFTIPGADSWTLIFNKKAEQWGGYDYAESEDALRVEVKPGKGDAVETMEFVIEDGAVVLRWDTTAVSFGVAAG